MLVKLGGLEFPRMCPACGGRGEVRLECAKSLRGVDSDDQEIWTVLTHRPWFCAACAAAHERERWRPGIGDYGRRLVAGGGEMLGAAVALGVGLLFLKDAVVKLSLVLLVFSALPLGVAWYLIRKNWQAQAYRCVAPPTAVTGAVDFTEDQAAEFEPAWVRFTFRNAAYAEAFREVNRKRIWNPGGGEAVAARQKRAWAERQRRWMYTAVGVAVVVFGIAAWWFGWD